ncbi:hypothetical protein DBV15_06046 [Temnothorax longispinosus]|uniref:Uncharacterized protein n=1 Tax=Temnothorax longispinosus TaxID=300112 RepID=A0A4S2L5M3_9HYME|nr:hypothetical protein DBV15_06046 [Temnothorax longispinosus]
MSVGSSREINGFRSLRTLVVAGARVGYGATDEKLAGTERGRDTTGETESEIRNERRERSTGERGVCKPRYKRQSREPLGIKLPANFRSPSDSEIKSGQERKKLSTVPSTTHLSRHSPAADFLDVTVYSSANEQGKRFYRLRASSAVGRRANARAVNDGEGREDPKDGQGERKRGATTRIGGEERWVRHRTTAGETATLTATPGWGVAPAQKDRHQTRTGTALEVFLHATHWLPQKSLNPAPLSTNREQMALLAPHECSAGTFTATLRRWLRV